MNSKILIQTFSAILIIGTVTNAQLMENIFQGFNELFGIAEKAYVSGDADDVDGGDKGILSCYCGRNRYLRDALPSSVNETSADLIDIDDDDDERIVGGRKITNSQDPWMAQVRRGGSFICGGTVINDLYVLTAAHCLYPRNGRSPYHYSSFSVRLDTYRRDVGGQIFGVTKYIYPYRYYKNRLNGNFNDFVGDVAILRLNRRIPLTSGNIRPVCLPSFNFYTFDRKYGKITGWGQEGDNIGTSYILKQGYSLALNYRTCPSYRPLKRPSYGEMCGRPNYGSGICFGDSGGPFTLNLRGNEYQIGVASHIIGTCSLALNRPNIFVDMTVYDYFVRYYTRDGNYCREL